ncbi:MAG: DivIVA domain-containing protein, partial [Clostridiaceae bacterium]|nr:DivIVA domain-containing protein [Clostridiaceae bacterium]
DAEKKAKNLVSEAHNTAREIIAEANKEVVRIKFEAERLKKDLAVYKSKMAGILNAQLKLLEEFE